MDGLHLAGVGAVVDEVVLGLLSDEAGVRQFLPVNAIEGGLNSDLHLTLQHIPPDCVRAGRVGHGQGGGLAARRSDRHLQDVRDDTDLHALHLIGDGAQLHAREVVAAHQ